MKNNQAFLRDCSITRKTQSTINGKGLAELLKQRPMKDWGLYDIKGNEADGFGRGIKS